MPGVNFEPHPARFESARIVEHERRQWPVLIGRHQEVRLQQHLKTVANSQDEFARIAEFGERIGQMMLHLISEDAPSGNVVAVTEAAGNAHNLKVAQPLRLFAARGLYAIARPRRRRA